MSKKLSKFGKLGKIGTAISTMLLTSMLHCNATTFQQKADVKLTTPNAKYLSVGKTTKSYKQASSQYKSQKSFDTLFNILNSDLNKMTDYTILEADVQKKLAEMYAQMNANSLDLACAFKAFEYNTFIDSGLSLEEAIEISETVSDLMYIVNDADTEVSVSCAESVNTGADFTVTVDISKLDYVQVTGTRMNGKGEEQIVDGPGIALKDLLSGQKIQNCTKVVVVSDDSYNAELTAEEVADGSKAFLIVEEENELRLVVFGDTNSKRSVSNVVQIVVE